MDVKQCKHFGKCGNCEYLNIPYEKTLDNKVKYVNKCFEDESLKIKARNIIGMDNPYGYRNKMILSFSNKNGKLKCGFYEQKSHNVIDIDECLLHSSLQNELIKYLKELVVKYKIRIYDEDKKTGLLRSCLIREAYYTKEILITFVTSEAIFPGRANIVKDLVSNFPNIKTIIQNINPRKTSVVLGEKEIILYGTGYIQDTILNHKFLITSKSFYQVNPIQVEKLYSLAYKNACFKGNEVIIDAYSGIGTIGIIASRSVKKVISVENNPDSHMAAIKNAKLNKVTNCYFVNDDATRFIKTIKEKIDAIILDPPRDGASIEFLKSVMHIKPRKVIYISCEPRTLARDLKVLSEMYNIVYVDCVDMFPFTEHCETVCLLTKKDKK